MRLPAALAVVFVLAAVAAGCGGNGASDEASDRPTPTPEPATPTIFNPGPAEAPLEAPEGAAFYIPSDPLPPGEPGEIIWAAEVQAPPGALAWKVLYHSTSVDGRDIAVSGFVIAPDEPFGEALRPVVTWAHGTTGIADHCAPSLGNDPAGIPLLADYLAAGYVVAATDYEGLGTPGVHPYLVGESEGRSVLDAARAAMRLPPTGAGGPVIIHGHSQGGHAALFAGEIADDYAPDLDIAGVVAAAPVTELEIIAPFLQLTPYFGFLLLAGLGFDAAYEPDLTMATLTEDGRELAGIAETGCVAEVIATFAAADPEAILASPPLENAEMVARAARNTPGNEAIEAPVLVIHGSEDELLPASLTPLYAEKACVLGTELELVFVPGNHGASVVGEGVPQLALDWIAARIAGQPPASNCGALPYPGQRG